MACACGVEPIPASLENRPRFAPWLRAIFSAAPKPPPIMAWGLKAYLNIMPKVAGTYLMRAMSIARPPTRNMAAIMGTIFSVTEARRCTPPRNMKPQIATSTAPITQLGMPKAVEQVEPMHTPPARAALAMSSMSIFPRMSLVKT